MKSNLAALCMAASLSALLAVPGIAEEAPLEADVIVVGAGAAGLTAGIEAANNGATVIILESQSSAGGTTKVSGAHYYLIDEEMNSVEGFRDEEFEAKLQTYLEKDPAEYGEYEKTLTILQDQIREYLDSDDTTKFDTVERWMIDHYDLCHGYDLDHVEDHVMIDLIRPAYEASEDTYHWLLDQGITFEDETYDVRGLTPVGLGYNVVNILVENAEKAGATFVYDTEAYQLLTDENGKVTGVAAHNASGEEVTYTANKAVVLATGGFGSNGEMVAEYNNTSSAITAEVLSPEGKGCTGLGITMAQELGADTVDMQFIELFGYTQKGACNIEFMFPVWFSSVLWLDNNAEKFTDEKGFMASNAALTLDDPKYYTIIPEEKYSDIPENIAEFFGNTGALVHFDSVEAAAEATGLDAEALQAAIDAYNADPSDAAIGESFYMSLLMLCVQNTPGGLVINPDAQVLTAEKEPIPGLYAAGEVTGGLEGNVHSHGDNYQEIFYYGRTAGANAASN